MKTIIVIPARMDSKRLPGKPLLMADGQALLHWTYAQAKRTKADHVVVTSSNREVGKYCGENGITFFPSSEKHENGTSRCWEIVERSKETFDRVINWQVDEPCVDPSDVDMLLECEGDYIGTLATMGEFSVNDPNAVKVVFNSYKCFWFSRAPMRGASLHIGVYGFPPSVLQAVSYIQSSVYSKAESLEQLAWIENEIRIYAEEVSCAPLSINTQEDWDKFKKLYVEGGE